MNLFNWRKARGPSLSAEQLQRREQLLPAAAASELLLSVNARQERNDFRET